MQTARLLVVMALVLSVLAAARDPIVGRWQVRAQPEGPGTEFRDTLEFRGMRMTAEELSKAGWESAEYEDNARRGGIAAFTSTLRHPDGSTMRWEGTVSARSMRGTILWTDPAGNERRYSFTGERL